MMQRSVSGNQHVGCNALIVSGLRHKQYSKDNYDDLTFCATSTEGGLALSKSHTDGSLIRVFRSSKLNSIYRANESICGETCSCGCCVLNGFAFKKRYKSNIAMMDFTKLIRQRKLLYLGSRFLFFVLQNYRGF